MAPPQRHALIILLDMIEQRASKFVHLGAIGAVVRRVAQLAGLRVLQVCVVVVRILVEVRERSERMGLRGVGAARWERSAAEDGLFVVCVAAAWG